MILTTIPFSSSKNLGRAYNEVMERLRDDDWVVFLDHDAMFTTKNWHDQIVRAVQTRPDAGMLTGVANRTGNLAQRAVPAINQNDHNYARHRLHGELIRKKFGDAAVDITNRFPIGGVVMVLSKRSWRRTGGFVDGLLCVDHRMHLAMKRAGLRVYLLRGLYLYHWRRAHNDISFLRGAPTAKCPCTSMRHLNRPL